MSEYVEIWPSATGILDLQTTWAVLQVEEMISVRRAWRGEQERMAATEQLDRFREQLSREWAIETGIIENLYEIERGVTRTLIAEGFQAALLETGATNKPRDWVIQLLKDQKAALDGLFSFVAQERTLSTSYIKGLHSVMLQHQAEVDTEDAAGNLQRTPLLRGDWKRHPNYPKRKPSCMTTARGILFAIAFFITGGLCVGQSHRRPILRPG